MKIRYNIKETIKLLQVTLKDYPTDEGRKHIYGQVISAFEDAQYTMDADNYAYLSKESIKTCYYMIKAIRRKSLPDYSALTKAMGLIKAIGKEVFKYNNWVNEQKRRDEEQAKRKEEESSKKEEYEWDYGEKGQSQYEKEQEEMEEFIRRMFGSQESIFENFYKSFSFYQRAESFHRSAFEGFDFNFRTDSEPQGQNKYEKALGIKKPYTDKELRSAYLAKMKEHHPDAGGSEEKAKEINEAYSKLKV